MPDRWFWVGCLQEVDEKCCGEYLTEPRLSPRAGEIRGDPGADENDRRRSFHVIGTGGMAEAGKVTVP